MTYKYTLVCLVLLLSLGGCASNTANDQIAVRNLDAQAQNAQDPYDPIEPVNRVIWDVNWNVLDKYLVRPVTVAYITVMPDFARKGLLNAADNLSEPGHMVNNFLQGKDEEGLESFARFVLNSTFGVFGLIDVASHAGLEKHDEGFDEVLGVWGAANGPFLMLPGAGPNDVRGVVGDVVDNTYYPLAILNTQLNAARWAITLLEARASLMDQEELLRESFDDYAFVKNAYFQNKLFQVTDGNVPEPEIEDEQLDDFEEFESLLEDTDPPKKEE